MSDDNTSEPTQPMAFQRIQPDRPNRPSDVLRDGKLKATIWRNEHEKGAFYSTNLSKTYEDRNGNVQDGQSFLADDLPKLAILTNKAYSRIRELPLLSSNAKCNGSSETQSDISAEL